MRLVDEDKSIAHKEDILLYLPKRNDMFCSQCGAPTKFISMCLERYLCSEECLDKENELITRELEQINAFDIERARNSEELPF